MGVFDDKKFENLDWISQATEPIDSELNEVLGAIPEEIDIDFDTYKKMVGESYGLDLSVDYMISWAVKKFADKTLSYEHKRAIRPCFEIQMDDTVYLNFETQKIDGSIKLIKIQSTMDEKILEGLLGREGISAVGNMWMSDSGGLSRANDIMELLGKCEEGLRTRSPRKKKFTIQKRVTQLFKDNEWKIKDTELANKVGFWIRDYVKDGNLAAYSNFCRLKVMTHKDQPIYSMEEVE
jgi:hypothetical protein